MLPEIQDSLIRKLLVSCVIIGILVFVMLVVIGICELRAFGKLVDLHKNVYWFTRILNEPILRKDKNLMNVSRLI